MIQKYLNFTNFIYTRCYFGCAGTDLLLLFSWGILDFTQLKQFSILLVERPRLRPRGVFPYKLQHRWWWKQRVVASQLTYTNRSS